MSLTLISASGRGQASLLLRNCLLSLRSSSWRLVPPARFAGQNICLSFEYRKSLMTHFAFQSCICLGENTNLSKIIIVAFEGWKESCFGKQLCPCFVVNVIVSAAKNLLFGRFGFDSRNLSNSGPYRRDRF